MRVPAHSRKTSAVHSWFFRGQTMPRQRKVSGRFPVASGGLPSRLPPPRSFATGSPPPPPPPPSDSSFALYDSAFQFALGDGTPTKTAAPLAGLYSSSCERQTQTVRGHAASAAATTSGVVFLSLRLPSSSTIISGGHHSWRIHTAGMPRSESLSTRCAVMIVLHTASRTSRTRASSWPIWPMWTATPRSENSLANGPRLGESSAIEPDPRRPRPG